ncbi:MULTISPECIES: SGNH/GDSL hydrolase family protein [Thermomonosporaceae]|uniref:SGNH/GDSL hydrolase family protein n=1 Tax=Thermomonosporaceae TaxID=2012 RepID=UPI00255A8C4C|nr:MULTISPECIES: SGNH/GDSL hydrolase family protein [Thermomonosporaceae]MDL4774741.1 SGNH/GDSL hydrolase family protein [Actinomadura xylanilytica]
MSEHTDPFVLPAGEAAALMRGAPWRRLVTVGDSVAEGVRDPAPGYRDLSWVDRVEEALAAAVPDLAALNLGRRDLVAAEIRATQLRPALEFRPDLAIVVGGGNDMLAPEFDADAVRAELAAMVSAFREAGADVLTIGLFDITAAGLGPRRFRAAISARTRLLGELTAEVAAEHGAHHVHNPPDHPAASDPGIYSADRLHFNARGHAIAAAGTIRALAGLLGPRR